MKPIHGYLAMAMALLTGCMTTRFEPKLDFPPPLVVRIPAVVGIYISPEFRTAVHSEERDGGKYEVVLGKAQSEGFERLMNAMFTRTVPVTATDAGGRTDPQIRGVLEPILEDYSFVTPRDAGARIFAQVLAPELVSIAGVYRTFDEGFPAELSRQPAQIRLVGDRIDISSLGSGQDTKRH